LTDDVIHPRPLSRSGIFGAVIVAAPCVLPSLVPRAGLIQGLLLGSCAAIGYGVGCLAGLRWKAPATRRDLWLLVVVLGALVLGSRWQAQLTQITGVAAYSPLWILESLLGGLVVFGVWLALARAIRWATVRLAGAFQRLTNPRVAGAGAVTVSALVLVLALDRLPNALVITFHPLFVSMNASSAAVAPTSDYVSGGPSSTIAWQDLGSQGQQFVSGATSSVELRQFNGRPALAPIRAFVGVDSAASEGHRADLAVAELERLGGFQRAVIAIGTSAGSGTVDPGEVTPLEYLLNGDVATVSTQYSILPSFLSFLVDKPNAARAASTLLDAVRERAAQQPRPPRIVVFGESLGAYGSSSAFVDLQSVLDQTDGALWQGPPNASPLWQRYTAARDPGSPQVQPVLDNGQHLRWANQPSALSLPTPWDAPRVVFLQNASDPVVWWSPRAAWSRPEWMAQPRGPGVLPWVPWLPLTTFAGLTGDMINSQGVPPGHGHVYGTDPVYAWAAILARPGWTAQDSERLAAHLG
jgi:uncharacterized membrane protein